MKRGSKVTVTEFHPPLPPAPLDKTTETLHLRIDELEESIEQRRSATRESLLMFGPQKRAIRITLKTLDEFAMLLIRGSN